LTTGQQKSELKRIDEERKAEIAQVVEKYLKKRDAIIDALVAKEVSLIVERYPHTPFARLDLIPDHGCVVSVMSTRSKPSWPRSRSRASNSRRRGKRR
jgi:hypothetical protein